VGEGEGEKTSRKVSLNTACPGHQKRFFRLWQIVDRNK
jgi:hypothetical protein